MENITDPKCYDIYHLKQYKQLMTTYHKKGAMGNLKECFDLPYYLCMLTFYIETNDYKKAVDTLEDDILCYDIDDPRISYIARDTIMECERNVDKILESICANTKG